MRELQCYWLASEQEVAKYFRFPALGSMADQEGHCCVGCGVAMAQEDGHDNCVLCLGHEHALVSKGKSSVVHGLLYSACTY